MTDVQQAASAQPLAKASEGDSAQPLAKAASDQPSAKASYGDWSTREARLLVASQLGILGIVMGSFFYPNLQPALEADTSLSWTMMDTTRLATFTNAASMVGLFAAGPLADYIRPTKLLACNALVVCIGMFAFASSTAAHHLILIACTLNFMRGVMWPAANVIIVSNLPLLKHDAAFLSSAFGSRLGDVVGPLILAVSLQLFGLHWRSAVLVILAAVALFFTSSFGAAPKDLQMPEPQEPVSLAGLGQKLTRLLCDVDGWLVFVANCGTYAVWSLYDYAAVLLVDLYGLSPGVAAESAAFISMGSAVGLVVAFFASNMLGSIAGRKVHVLQSASATVALFVLSVTKAPLELAHALLFATGFGFVAIAYVPFLVYAARSRVDERAFRTAVVDGVSQLIGIGFSYSYGVLRGSRGLQGVPVIFSIAALCMGTATLSLAHFYRRLQAREREEVRALSTS